MTPLLTAFRVEAADPAHPERCQDRVAVVAREEGVIMVVADGMGGRAGGAQAAELAVARLHAAVKPGGSLFDSRGWVRAIGEVDQELHGLGQGSETTIVVVASDGERIMGASVGDSGAWMLRGKRGAIVELTSGQRRERAGSGVARAYAFDTRWDGGTLLVATDGVLKYVPPPVILRAVAAAEVAGVAEELVKGARLRSGALQDDLGLVVCRVG